MLIFVQSFRSHLSDNFSVFCLHFSFVSTDSHLELALWRFISARHFFSLPVTILRYKMAHHQESQLEHQLSSCEFMIHHLLKSKPPQEDVINKKLNQLDQLILQIPVDLPELAATWKETARSFRKKFAQVILPVGEHTWLHHPAASSTPIANHSRHSHQESLLSPKYVVFDFLS